MESEKNKLTDRPNTMYEVVRLWADCTPNAPAIVASDQSTLTYRDLLRTIDKVGAKLNACGLGRNDRVAIVHPGGTDMAVTILGVWSHATAIPLNPSYTVAEFAMHFRDLAIGTLAVAEGMDTPARDSAQMLKIPVFEIVSGSDDGTDAVEIKGGIAGTPKHPGPAKPDDIALVLTTSGTTSHSKIVPIRHRHIVYRSEWTARDPRLTAADRCLVLNQLFHHAGIVTGCCPSLFTGGSFSHLWNLSVETFCHDLAILKPTWTTGSHAVYASIQGHTADYKEEIERARKHLKWFRVGNGRFEPDDAAQLEAEFHASVITVYGTSETGTLVTESLNHEDRKPNSVGTPIYDGLAILDENGESLPAGEIGEVSGRGPMVFDGYENDPEANRAAFTNGWFRTGDQGYFDKDGYLFLTGRIKEMINRGGEKITPNEVDHAIMRHPDVSAAAAFPIPHPTLGEEVAAAVVLKKGAVLPDRSLAQFLRDCLAGFKVPRRFIFVDEIPKGPTGKIQRHKLAAAFDLDGAAEDPEKRKDAVDGVSSRAPSDLEARLSALWAKALGLERVGLDEDFFLLGGDSLQAVELFLGVEKAFGQRLPRSVLFEAGTVSEMAKRIEAAVPSSCIVPVQPEGDRPPFFCVHGGTGHVLNFRDLARHLGPGQPFYAIQAAGLDGSSAPYLRTEEMAAYYIGEMRKVQPSGPYYLGGFSFGGRVAFVMARQLRAAGEEVGLLALLDPYSRVGSLRVPLGEWLGRQWAVMRGLRLAAVPGYLWRRVKRFTGRLWGQVRLRALQTAWRYYETRGRDIPGVLRRVDDAMSLAAERYRPAPYEGNAVLFQAERNIRTHADAHAGWHKLVQGGLEVHPIPCRHHQIMEEPYVRELAREIGARLNGESNRPE